MNLWVKRIGQLTLMSVALFFFSCQDESSLLGFRNPSSKFDLGYIDIPIESSVLLLDSTRTSNFNVGNDLNRFLVGNYTDPVFGKVAASTFTQFYPLGKLAAVGDSLLLVYDSASLLMRFDFYAYGSDGETEQTFDVYQLQQYLSSTNGFDVSTNVGGQHLPNNVTLNYQKLYYNSSSTAYYPTRIGTGVHSVELEDFNFNFNDATPKNEVIEIPLEYSFGEGVFEIALTGDSTFTRSDLFTKIYYGLAIVPGASSDKVVGFYPTDDSSRFRLHYHTVRKKDLSVKDTLRLDFALNRVSYNQLDVDRSASDLAGLTTPFEDYAPTDTRYIQSGGGVVTKLDISKFMEFAQSDTIKRLAINSAELIIKDVDEEAQFLPPTNLLVRVLKDDNRAKKLTFPGKSSAYQADLDLLNLYEGRVNFDRQNTSVYHGTAFDSTFTVSNDLGGFFMLNYSSDDKKYSGTANYFFQQLFKLREESESDQFTKLMLVPHEAATSTNPLGRHINGKTLNRVTFDKDNIFLRVYYTIPKEANQ